MKVFYNNIPVAKHSHHPEDITTAASWPRYCESLKISEIHNGCIADVDVCHIYFVHPY